MIRLNSEYQKNPFDYFEPEPNPPVKIGSPQENRLSSDINVGAYVTRNDVKRYDDNGNSKPHHIVNTGKAFFNYGVVGELWSCRRCGITH